MFSRISIRIRLMLLVGLSLALLAFMWFANKYNTSELVSFNQEFLKKNLEEEKKYFLKAQVVAGAAMLSDAIKNVDNPQERDKIITRVISDPNNMFYPLPNGKKVGYYFVYSKTTVKVVPGKPELTGKDLSDAKDNNGVRYVYELYQRASSGGGFVEYIFSKPGEDDKATFPKLAYAMNVPDTDVWIGTGLYVDDIQEQHDLLISKTNELSAKLNTRLLILTSVVVLLFLVLTYFVFTSINKPLASLIDFSSKVAQGNLDADLELKDRHELLSLKNALTSMVTSLKSKILEATEKTQHAQEQTEIANQAMKDAQDALNQAELAKREGQLAAAKLLSSIVDRLSFSTKELSSQVSEISSGMGLQSSRIAETATAIEEMNATVLEVAKNASNAADNAQQARDKADGGSDIVKSSLTAIENVAKDSKVARSSIQDLGEKAKAIGGIINVINDIADQTNLLAMQQ